MPQPHALRPTRLTARTTLRDGRPLTTFDVADDDLARDHDEDMMEGVSGSDDVDNALLEMANELLASETFDIQRGVGGNEPSGSL